jgi:hypothetical protein
MLALFATFGGVRAADEPTLGPLLASSDWINGPASARALNGKVVLVDVFTFGCYNCRNVVPNLRALHRSQAGELVILGVHTPETPYERVRSNVVANLAAQGITWPVALDNTQLIFDRHGRLRQTIVGDSQDAAVNRTIQALIAQR